MLDAARIDAADVLGYALAKLSEQAIEYTDVHEYSNCHQPPESFINGEHSIWALTGGRGCVAAGTLIYNPFDETHTPVEDWQGGPVLSWDGDGWSVRPSSRSFLKGSAPLFRVATARGDAVTVTGRHRFLTRSGWEHLDQIDVGTEIASIAPSALRGDDRRWWRTPEGSQDGCRQQCRSCGQQPQSLSTGDPVQLPSPGDAHAHSRDGSPEGDDSSSPSHTRHGQQSDHLTRTHSSLVELELAGDPLRTGQANDAQSHRTRQGIHRSQRLTSVGLPYERRLREGQEEELSTRDQYEEGCPLLAALDAQPSVSRGPSLGQRETLATSHRCRGVQCERGPLLTVQSSQACLDSIWWERIASVEPAGSGDFYDLTVADTHNYVANGIVHHNSGKTFSAAIYYNQVMRGRPGTKGRIICSTVGEAVQSCVLGESGLITLYPDIKMTGVKGVTTLRWPNGSEAAVLGCWTKRDIPKLRGISNRTIDWFEEFTHMPLMREVFEQAALGRRIGNVQALITTTPTAHEYWAAVLKMRAVIHTHGTMFDNPHLSDEYRAFILDMFEGTSLAGQEIYGEILTDVDGALWKSTNLNLHRLMLGRMPDFDLIFVGVDPAVGSGTTGIVAAGSFQDDQGVWHICALEDRSITDAEPDEWAKAAIDLAIEWDAPAIIAEQNQGQRLVRSNIKHAIDHHYPEMRGLKVDLVHARDGKHVRASPVAMLHEQGRGHVLGRLPLLENELTTWVEGVGASPDRLDAYVWAATKLMERFRRGRSSLGAVNEIR